jgi:hypothetical protein
MSVESVTTSVVTQPFHLYCNIYMCFRYETHDSVKHQFPFKKRSKDSTHFFVAIMKDDNCRRRITHNNDMHDAPAHNNTTPPHKNA